LSGRILDDELLASLRGDLECQLPGLQIDVSGVQVLRQKPPRMVTVSTNLVGLFAQPSWLSEQISQLLYGFKIEVLDQQGRWAFIRQRDGYLGWTYLSYLSPQPAPDPTHVVVAPVSLVRTECPQVSEILGRLLCGTPVQVVSVNGACAEVDAHVWGWVTASEVRAMDSMPRTTSDRRDLMMQDAGKLVGVPYQWGGCTAMGIDCSGFSQLLHRWIGVAIPRDADLQYKAGRKVEFPYQPGDLLFFGEQGSDRHITHVAVSLGEWRIIHSSRARNGVYIDEVQEVPHLRESFAGAASFV
jgi:cell wall-associated NlpC family hydrolase